MRSHLALAFLFAAPAFAQNCIDGDLGVLVGVNTTDTVLPMYPIGFAFPIGAATYTHVHITDHGFVQLSNAGVPAPQTSQVLYNPSLANFAADSPKVCALWSDIVGTNGGLIYLSPRPTKCVITWLNMQNYGMPAPRFDFQLTLFPNGDVRCVYGPNCTNNSTFPGIANHGIAGITPGNYTALPAASDLSVTGSSTDASVFEEWTTPATFDIAHDTLVFTATNPGYSFTTLGPSANCASVDDFGVGCGPTGYPMHLTSMGRPSLGNSWYTLLIDNVPPISAFAFVASGDTVVDPGQPLDTFGMPGCFAYTNLNLGMYTAAPVVSFMSSLVYPIPNLPALAGFTVSAQAVAFTTLNPANLFVSNGTAMHLGF
jgi:hypothetical protein